MMRLLNALVSSPGHSPVSTELKTAFHDHAFLLLRTDSSQSSSFLALSDFMLRSLGGEVFGVPFQMTVVI